MIRPRHIAASIMLAAIAAIMASVAADAQGRHYGAALIDSSETEQGFIRCELPGVFTRDVTVRFVNDTLLLPYTAFANLLGIINHISSDRDTVSGEMPLGQPFSLIASRERLRRPGIDDTLPARSVAIVDGDVYVSMGVLTRCMGIQASFDLSDLRLGVVPDTRIPAVEHARNRSLYAALNRHDEGAIGGGSSLHRQLLGSAAIRWGVVHTLREGVSNSIGTMQIAGPFLYGILNVSGGGQVRPSETNAVTGGLNAANWQIEFPDFSPMRRLSLDVARSAGATSIGLAVGNAPLGGRTEFGIRSIDGRTQPGWDVEMYDGANLIEVTHADEEGEYHFRMPVGYGTTTRTIQQVGPHGERITEQRTFRLSSALVPPGDLQYSSSLFSQSTRFDRAVSGNVIATYGINNRLSVGSIAAVQSSNIHELRGDSLNVGLLANVLVGDATPVGVYYNPVKQSVGGLVTYTFSDNMVVQAAIDSFDLRNRNVYIANGSFNVDLGWLSIGGFGQVLNNSRLTAVSASPQLSFFVSGIGVTSSAKFGWLTTRADAGVGARQMTVASTLQVTAAPWNGVFLMAHAAYDHTARALTNLDFSSSISLGSSLSLGVSYSTERLDWKRGTVYVQCGYNFGIARASVGSSYQNGTFSTVSSLEGGVLISHGGVYATQYEAINQSAIIIHAFHDANVNGVRDNDEEIMENPTADLSGRGGTIHTDDGTFFSLNTYQESLIAISPERFAGQGLYPRKSEFRVYTLPGVTTVLDVPYAEGFDVYGHCRIVLPESGGRTASTAILTSLKVCLVSADTHAEYCGEVFDDGSLTIEGVSAGHYQMVFDDAQLAARGLRLDETCPVVDLTKTATTLPVITFVPDDSSKAPITIDRD